MKNEWTKLVRMAVLPVFAVAAAWMAGCNPTDGNEARKDSPATIAPRMEAAKPVEAVPPPVVVVQEPPPVVVAPEPPPVVVAPEPPPVVVAQEAPVVAVQATPTVVAEAAAREAAKQDGTWTSENIQQNPYLFIQDQIRNCDQLKAKIEAQSITMTRLNKQAARSIEEADAMTARYTAFLKQAKAAYKQAEASGKWPVTLNGYQLDEEQLGDRIADALDRIELAKKDRADGEVIVRKTAARKDVLKAKGRELASLRLKLVQQGEQVKMNSQLAEINDLSNVLGLMKDMMLEIDEDPTRPNLEDLTADDPNAARKRAIRAFLDD